MPSITYMVTIHDDAGNHFNEEFSADIPAHLLCQGASDQELTRYLHGLSVKFTPRVLAKRPFKCIGCGKAACAVINCATRGTDGGSGCLEGILDVMTPVCRHHGLCEVKAMQVNEHKCNHGIMKAFETMGRPDLLESHRAILACVVCGNTDNPKSCGRCNNSCYCSRTCQRSHWPIHQAQCRALSMF